jgi:RHS repeat-associated protein
MKRGVCRMNANRTSLVANTKTFAEHWTLDATGNWLAFKQDTDGDGVYNLDQSRTHNVANEVLSLAGASTNVAYDLSGNMTKAPQPGDWASHYTLQYDAWNRLSAVTIPVTGGLMLVAGHNYDGLGRRIEKETYTAGSLTEVRHFYYSNQWQVLEERIEGGYGSSSSSNSSSSNIQSLAPVSQFIWGQRYVDDLILRDRDTDSDGVLNERLYALHDANWNVVALTDTSGTIIERYRYTAYGVPTFLDATFANRSSSLYAWDTLYCGYRHESLCKWYHVRNRYYHPIYGRFVNRDPASYKAGNFNLYRYVHNRPLIYVDPTGHGEKWDDFWGVGWWDSWTASNCRDTANAVAKDLSGIYSVASGWGGEVDAVRHCVWLSCMTQKIDADQAKEVADNHEKHNPPPKCKCPPKGFSSQEEWARCDADMDEHNNQVGIEIGKDSKADCASACKKALEDGRLKVCAKGGYTGQSGCKSY